MNSYLGCISSKIVAIPRWVRWQQNVITKCYYTLQWRMGRYVQKSASTWCLHMHSLMFGKCIIMFSRVCPLLSHWNWMVSKILHFIVLSLVKTKLLTKVLGYQVTGTVSWSNVSILLETSRTKLEGWGPAEHHCYGLPTRSLEPANMECLSAGTN